MIKITFLGYNMTHNIHIYLKFNLPVKGKTCPKINHLQIHSKQSLGLAKINKRIHYARFTGKLLKNLYEI
jgi:hypothetical protein